MKWLLLVFIPLSLVSVTNTQALILNDLERQWIESNPVIRYTIDNSYPPFEFTNGKGEPEGISGSYLQNIHHQLNIRFEFVRTESWPEALQKLKTGEIELLPAVAFSEKRSEYMLFTEPYIALPQYIISQQNSPAITDMRMMSGRYFAVVKGYFSHEVIARKYPDVLLHLMDSPLSALLAVRDGHVEGTTLNFGVAAYIMNQYKIRGLKMIELPDIETQGLRMGVKKDMPELARLLNKSIASITEQSHQRILSRWVELSHFKDLRDTPEKQDQHKIFDFTVMGLLFLTLIVLLVFFLQKTIRR